MALEEIIVWLVIGAIAGWLAGLIMKGYGFGLIGNIVVGIIGAVIAGWLLPDRVCSRRRHRRGNHQRRYRGSDSLVRDRALQKGSVKSRRAPRPSNPGCFEAQKWGGFKARSQVEAKSMRWPTWFSGLNAVAGGQQHAKRMPSKLTTMLYVPASFGQLPPGQNWLKICPTN